MFYSLRISIWAIVTASEISLRIAGLLKPDSSHMERLVDFTFSNMDDWARKHVRLGVSILVECRGVGCLGRG